MYLLKRINYLLERKFNMFSVYVTPSDARKHWETASRKKMFASRLASYERKIAARAWHIFTICESGKINLQEAIQKRDKLLEVHEIYAQNCPECLDIQQRREFKSMMKTINSELRSLLSRYRR